MAKDKKFLLQFTVALDRRVKIESPTGMVDSGIAYDVGQALMNLARSTQVELPDQQGEVVQPTGKNIEA